MDGFFKNPQLSVARGAISQPERFSSSAKCATPAPIRYPADMSLIEAISQAQAQRFPAPAARRSLCGPSRALPATALMLPTHRGTEVTRVDLKELQSGALTQNVALKDGDTIFVARAETIYVFGQVRNPGAYADSERHHGPAGLVAGGRCERARRYRPDPHRAGWRRDRKSKSTSSSPTLCGPETRSSCRSVSSNGPAPESFPILTSDESVCARRWTSIRTLPPAPSYTGGADARRPVRRRLRHRLRRPRSKAQLAETRSIYSTT